MEGVTIKPEIPESLMTVEDTHNVACTDLTISALYYSGANGEGVTEFKLESQMTNPVKNEEPIGVNVIDPSSGMISDLVVIAPQVENYHKHKVSLNEWPNAPDSEEETKQDISAAKQEMKQEIMEIFIKKEETGDVPLEQIHNKQTIQEEIQDCKEHIKLEDDMNYSWVDNINETVKTETRPVVLKNELSEEKLQEDLSGSERFDGDLSQSDDQVSNRTVKPRNHHRTATTTPSDGGSDYDQSHSLSSGKELIHKKKEINALRSKCQSHRNRRSINVKRLKKDEEYVLSNDSCKDQQRTQTGGKQYGCTLCNKRFRDHFTLKRHQRIHTGEKPHGCTLCDKRFRNRSDLTIHQRFHTGEKPYACIMCDKSCRDQQQLQVHQRTHTGEKPYGCTMCDKSFRDKATLKRHHKIHTGEKPYQCTSCDDSFRIQSDLKRHQRTHTGEKPYACTTCDKTFRGQSDLKVHQRTHSGEKPFGCTTCDKSFRTRQALQRHQITHIGEKSYACTLCDKSFKGQYYLTVHPKTHTREKPFACTTCDKRFKNQLAFRIHQRIHTGEKPYGCTICDQRFRSRQALRLHQRTHTGEKPYGCTMCNKSFRIIVISRFTSEYTQGRNLMPVPSVIKASHLPMLSVFTIEHIQGRNLMHVLIVGRNFLVLVI